MSDHQAPKYVHFEGLLAQAANMPAMPVAVVAPEKADALAGPVQAAQAGLIAPILIGDAGLMAEVADAEGLDISGYEVIDVADHSDAAARGVALVHEGRAKAVMKGHLHTDVLLRHVVKRDGGLRAGRRLSHVFICDVPGEDRLLLVTDGAINITPDLDTKADITQSGIDLARTLGVAVPNVAVLSAVETVNPKVQSTVDADALVKMAEAGEIRGGVVEGPLSMDIAVDQAAAVGKGMASEVAGRADIMIMPNLEAGNMFAKALTYYGKAEKAGIVLGASVPVILTSRSDGELARLVSCAVAVLYAARKDGLA